MISQKEPPTNFPRLPRKTIEFCRNLSDGLAMLLQEFPMTSAQEFNSSSKEFCRIAIILFYLILLEFLRIHQKGSPWDVSQLV